MMNQKIRKKEFQQKLHDAVFGFAIGDAIGVPYEFEERGSFLCTGMTGHGSHNQPAGTWSDDTSMTLATLDSLKEYGGIVMPDDMKEKFLAWLKEGKYTVNGKVFDVGITTYNALIHNEPGIRDNQNGNGSLMRILPLAFTNCIDEEIAEVSDITHANPVSEDACIIYVYIARQLLEGESLKDVIPSLIYREPFNRLNHINLLKEEDIRSTGYVVDTLEASLWCLSCQNAHHSFHEDVLRAVNLGYDTDTTAAVTGGLAGIIYGIGPDENEWVRQLKNKELINNCLSEPEG